MGGPSKTLLRPSDAQERKKLKKRHENDTPKWSQNNKKRVPKMGPQKGAQDLEKTKQTQPLSLIFCWGFGLLRKAQHCSSHIFDINFSLHYVSLRSRPPAERKAESEDKRNFANNYAASFVLRSSFSLASGISLGTLFFTGWC